MTTDTLEYDPSTILPHLLATVNVSSGAGEIQLSYKALLGKEQAEEFRLFQGAGPVCGGSLVLPIPAAAVTAERGGIAALAVSFLNGSSAKTKAALEIHVAKEDGTFDFFSYSKDFEVDAQSLEHFQLSFAPRSHAR